MKTTKRGGAVRIGRGGSCSYAFTVTDTRTRPGYVGECHSFPDKKEHRIVVVRCGKPVKYAVVRGVESLESAWELALAFGHRIYDADGCTLPEWEYDAAGNARQDADRFDVHGTETPTLFDPLA